MSIPPLLFIMLAILLASGWRIIAKQKTNTPKNDLAYTAIIEAAASVTSIVTLVLNGFDLTAPTNITLWSWFAASIAIATLSDYLLLVSTKYADLADTSILIPLSNFWTLLIAALFLGEHITPTIAISVTLIVIGSMVTLATTGKIILNKGITAILIYGVTVAVMNSIDKGISDSFSIPLYAALSYGVSAILLFVILGNKRIHHIRTELTTQHPFWMISIGVLWAFFSISLLSAYRGMDVSKVIPFIRFFIVVTTVYSITVLKERTRLIQKIIGSLIVTAGAIMLALA